MKITSENNSTELQCPVLFCILKRELKLANEKLKAAQKKRQKKHLRISVLSLFKCFEIAVRVSTVML